MSIYIDARAAGDTIAVTTRSSVYELIVLPGEQHAVLVRGGRHFPEFRPALLLGSTATHGALGPGAIAIGMRMILVAGGRFIITSAVQSASRVPAITASSPAS